MGMFFIRPLRDAILKQTENARREATMLRVHPTKEKTGQNPLAEAEGQIRLSLLAMLNVHGDRNDQRKCAFLFFPLEYYILSKGLVWCN